jgi:hypothetical protein
MVAIGTSKTDVDAAVPPKRRPIASAATISAMGRWQRGAAHGTER